MELSPERIYLEAVRAAGPAEEISDWRVKVDQIAGEILAGIKAFTKRMLVVQHSITLAGIVQDVVENPVSENNRALNLYKVVFKADSGSRPDQMWIDKNDPAGAALFAQAKALVGKRSRIVKEQRARFAGDDMVMKDGKPETSPYLASIKPEEEGAEPAPAAEATDDGKKLSPKLRGLLTIEPTSAQHVVELASQHFGMTPTDVKKSVESVIGKAEQGKKRSAEDLVKAWKAIVFQNAPAAAA